MKGRHKHVVLFSGGLGSWGAAKRLRGELGPDEPITLLFTDTKMEDEDLYRFLGEAAASVGGDLVNIADGRTPWDVFFDVRYLGNTRIDPCSRVLKREMAAAWIEANCDPDESTIYVGMDWTEQHRFDRARPRWEPWRLRAPLCEAPFIMGKAELAQWLAREGIEMPRLYGLGFDHNNCFSGDTKFLTGSGIRTLRECEGQQVQVLGKGGGWKAASVESFGEQRLWRIDLSRYGRRKTIHATADHIWFVRSGRNKKKKRVTQDLEPGSRLVSMHGLDEHLMRFSRASGRGWQRPAEWKVERVAATDRVEEVYCATVPDGHAFTLDGNILTHNCGGACVKAGQGAWLTLLKTMPERFAFHEKKEEELREHLDADVAILRDRTGGNTTPLTLRDLRERYERDGEAQIDLFEWGGCGCFAGPMDAA